MMNYEYIYLINIRIKRLHILTKSLFISTSHYIRCLLLSWTIVVQRLCGGHHHHTLSAFLCRFHVSCLSNDFKLHYFVFYIIIIWKLGAKFAGTRKHQSRRCHLDLTYSHSEKTSGRRGSFSTSFHGLVGRKIRLTFVDWFCCPSWNLRWSHRWYLIRTSNLI